MNHTPGTWRVGTPKGFNASIVYVDDGKEFPEGICSVIGVPLHSTVGEVEKMGRPEYQEALATARLIASAPELLEAVREAADYFHDFVESDHDEVRLAKIMRMAIQKATGAWNRSLEATHEQEQ